MAMASVAPRVSASIRESRSERWTRSGHQLIQRNVLFMIHPSSLDWTGKLAFL